MPLLKITTPWPCTIVCFIKLCTLQWKKKIFDKIHLNLDWTHIIYQYNHFSFSSFFFYFFIFLRKSTNFRINTFHKLILFRILNKQPLPLCHASDVLLNYDQNSQRQKPQLCRIFLTSRIWLDAKLKLRCNYDLCF